MTLDEATKAAKHGAVAAFISGTITAIVVGLALSMENQGELAAWNDPLNILDVVLLFGLGIGMLRKSRAAAVIAFIYFILAKIFIALETGAGAGIIGSIIFLFFFGRAIQGTFTYHRIRKAEDPNYRAAPKWSYFVGIPLAVLLFLAMGLGILSVTDVVPSTEVLPGSEVSEADVSLLVENDILFPDEEIEYFYSYGFVSVLEGGDILTDRAVITYYQDENSDLQIYSMNFDEITAVFRMEEGGALTDALYKVSSDDEDDWIIIELSTEKGGDLIFVDALRQKIRRAKEVSQRDTE